MEKLEIMADTEKISLRCSGWCHDYSPKIVYHSNLPDSKYFE